MSHFTMTVALSPEVPADAEKLRLALKEALAPFDENMSVVPYVESTQAEMMADKPFTTWWQDDHPEYTYATAVREWCGSNVDSNGNVLSTYNPRSRWDWWVVGGRWGGKWRFKTPVAYDYLKTQESAFGMSEGVDNELATDCGRVGDLAAETFGTSWGFITLDGEWVEEGKMGWWGMSDADESESGEAKWKKQYVDWLTSLPKDAWVVNVDCHI